MEGFILIIMIVVVYFLPTIIVLGNDKHSNKPGLFLFNLFLGWTFLGWVLALVWSFNKSN